MSLELDLQIALDMPGLPAATDLRRWAEAALAQAGLLGQRHHRHQPRARHEMLVIEHRGIKCKPMGHFHRKCLSCARRLFV